MGNVVGITETTVTAVFLGWIHTARGDGFALLAPIVFQGHGGSLEFRFLRHCLIVLKQMIPRLTVV